MIYNVSLSKCRNSSSGRDTKWTQQVKVISQTGFDILPDDGYIWRKYGQKELLDSKYPRYIDNLFLAALLTHKNDLKVFIL